MKKYQLEATCQISAKNSVKLVTEFYAHDEVSARGAAILKSNEFGKQNSGPIVTLNLSEIRPLKL